MKSHNVTVTDSVLDTMKQTFIREFAKAGISRNQMAGLLGVPIKTVRRLFDRDVVSTEDILIHALRIIGYVPVLTMVELDESEARRPDRLSAPRAARRPRRRVSVNEHAPVPAAGRRRKTAKAKEA